MLCPNILWNLIHAKTPELYRNTLLLLTALLNTRPREVTTISKRETTPLNSNTSKAEGFGGVGEDLGHSLQENKLDLHPHKFTSFWNDLHHSVMSHRTSAARKGSLWLPGTRVTSRFHSKGLQACLQKPHGTSARSWQI